MSKKSLFIGKRGEQPQIVAGILTAKLGIPLSEYSTELFVMGYKKGKKLNRFEPKERFVVLLASGFICELIKEPVKVGDKVVVLRRETLLLEEEGGNMRENSIFVVKATTSKFTKLSNGKAYSNETVLKVCEDQGVDYQIFT